VITASVKLDHGPLLALQRQIKDADGAYLKVGVLGSYVRRERGETGNKRWKSKFKRWNKAAGAYVESGPSWSASAGKYLTNAEIGAIHEFGAPKAGIPERSFLRMPVISRLGDGLKGQSLSDWEGVLLSGGLVGVLRVVGQAAVNVVQAAFHSGGFGRWAKLKPATIRRKKNSDPLVDTTQLRRSITFAVVTKGGANKT
jgi:phage gpG-like protein